MAVERIDKNRPVVYKNYVIHVNKDIRDRYIFHIKSKVDLTLSGVTDTLEKAFEEARKMIDQLEKNNE